MGQSAIYHGLTDDMVAAGPPARRPCRDPCAPSPAASCWRTTRAIEVDFLSRACEEFYGAPLVPPVVDTLELHDRIVNRGFDDESKGNELRLWNARQPLRPAALLRPRGAHGRHGVRRALPRTGLGAGPDRTGHVQHAQDGLTGQTKAERKRRPGLGPGRRFHLTGGGGGI